MEMISLLHIAVYAIVVLAAASLCWTVFQWSRHRFDERAPPPQIRRLSDEEVRTELSGFLRKHMVVGDADIREGVVFAPVPPDQLEPLARVLGNAAAVLAGMQNRAADVLYVRNRDGTYSMLEIDLDHLVDASRVMQRVAEDRHKSRSIYKGITDDELDAMTRAGLSQWYKSHGRPGIANEAMSGALDDAPFFGMSRAVLDLAFKVKGVRND